LDFLLDKGWWGTRRLVSVLLVPANRLFSTRFVEILSFASFLGRAMWILRQVTCFEMAQAMKRPVGKQLSVWATPPPLKLNEAANYASEAVLLISTANGIG